MAIQKHHLIASTLLGFVLIFACQDGNKKGAPLPTNLNKAGQALLVNNCQSCHSPSASMDNRLAPPMIAVKRHYIDEDVSLEQFTKELTSFLLEPTEEKSKMPGAVRKFGLMGKLGYTEAQIKDVAEYIYHADIEQPDWFEQHYEEEHGRQASSPANPSKDKTAKGLEYALATKAVLGQNLMGQITSQGTEAALRFCNVQAIPLTDSMALAQSVQIKRVSDRPRNPDNQANERELDYIHDQKERIAQGEKAVGTSFDHDGHTIGYYPIMTNTMCLQCHGSVAESVTPSVAAQIERLYPEDKAIGYQADELRGIWVVEME